MKVSLKRILFPTDFSPASECARNYACSIAGLMDAELHILHIIDDPFPIPGTKGSWVLPHEDLIARLVSQTETQLIEQTKDMGIRENRVTRSVKIGNPAREITDYAAKHDIDLIVLGTHGHSGLSHLLIGSVAEKVVRLSKCPVLTVHPTDHQFV